MTRVTDFARYLRDNVSWEDEAFQDEAFQMYADAINESRRGWFPGTVRAWLGWYLGTLLLGIVIGSALSLFVAMVA